MATRIVDEKIGKRRHVNSYALCDDCGFVSDVGHVGRVTAPLPAGWTLKEMPSKSGGSVKRHYSCPKHA